MPSASSPVGVKLYALSSFTVVDGVPVNVGTEFTLKLKLANAIGLAITLSVTEIITPEVVPASPLTGVPLNCPVAALKLAQVG